MRGRLLIDERRDPCTNLALEEALFSLNEGYTVRLWENARSVIIGRAQLARYETDMDYCREERIPVLRRFTAGGAVYNGPGNLNWSVFIGKGFKGRRLNYVWSAQAIFKMAAALVGLSLERLGVDARLEAPNRIVTPEGKVSGMAAYLGRGGFVCHGTLLLGADLAEASRLTRPSKRSLDRKYVRSKMTRIANVGLGSDAFIASLSEVAAEETDEGMKRCEPTRDELELAERLTAKYKDPDWNLGDPFEGDGRR